MTIPFIDLFKKLSDRFFPGGAAGTTTAEPANPVATPQSLARIKKASHPSLSKTVLPNRTRSSAAPDPFRAAAGVAQSNNPSMQLTPGKVVSSAKSATRSRELPRALALALEPKLERAVSLRISDFIEKIPAGFIKPVEILDVKALVSLKASEIEKGMAEGKPSVSLVSLYQQVPEIFLRSVPMGDATRVDLPYEKVYQQFKSVTVREDQEIDPDIPQVDTPILQVTLEETKKFGTKLEPLQSSVLPSVPVQPATAETIAKAEPEAVAVQSAHPGGPGSPHPVISLRSPNPTSKQQAAVKPSVEASTAIPKPPSPGQPAAVAQKQDKFSIEVPSKFPFKLPTSELKSPVNAPPEAPKPEAKTPEGPKISFKLPPLESKPPVSGAPEAPKPEAKVLEGAKISFKMPPAESKPPVSTSAEAPKPEAKVPEGPKISFKLPPVESKPLVSVTPEAPKPEAKVPEGAKISFKMPPVESKPPVTTPAEAPKPEAKVFEGPKISFKMPPVESRPPVSVSAPKPEAKVPEEAKISLKLPPVESKSPISTPAEATKSQAKLPEQPTISLQLPSVKPKPTVSAPTDAPKTESKVSSELKVPFQFPPNGTGVPASERVPASTGPPVPTNLATSPSAVPSKPPPAAPTTPEFVPFSSVTKPAIGPAPVKTAPVVSVPERQVPAGPHRSKISLALKPVLQNLPAFQLSGDVSGVPENVRMELPLNVVEPQLVKGRVAVAPEVFQIAIPETYRNLFHTDAGHSPVLLPLQEVLKNLPNEVLQLRPDQELIAAEKEIETPFSIRAKEDAELFVLAPSVAPKPPAPVEIETAPPAAAEKVDEQQPELDLEGESELAPKIDVKEVMTQTTALAGVKACAITFSDGLNLAGTLPPQFKADGLCAMAPSIFQKVARHMDDTKLGGLVALTLHSESQAVTFFAKENICLAVLQGDQTLSSEVREEIATLVQKLSRTYAQPEISHVDH